MGRSSTWHGPHRRRTAPRTSSDGGDAAADALALRGQACTKQQACAGRKTSTDPAARRPGCAGIDQADPLERHASRESRPTK
mmetsp:Transcript_27055/g.83355  ORF Transcript_27055/g.83355 Transcript_27055/m.83355 type:complete len:82 (-) Transcript_27055:952-1197(-)